MRKGQTAIEYLMTYGWAILIILVVGGVLYYYGVFSPTTLVGKQKTGFSGGVDVVDYVINSNGANPDSISVLVENRAGVQIIVTGVTVNGVAATSWSNVTLAEGARATQFNAGVTGNTNLTTSTAFNWDVAINYVRTDASGTVLTSSGKLTGKAA